MKPIGFSKEFMHSDVVSNQNVLQNKGDDFEFATVSCTPAFERRDEANVYVVKVKTKAINYIGFCQK